MKKLTNITKWVFRDFLTVTFVLLAIIYIRWFLLTPLVFTNYNDPNDAYIFGVKLFFVYFIFTILSGLAKNRHIVIKPLVIMPTILLLCVNIIYIFIFVPRIIASAKCDKTQFYITSNLAFPKANVGYKQITVWNGLLKYNSSFDGYLVWSNKIICDYEKDEVNIIEQRNRYTLVYTYMDGERIRSYDPYANSELAITSFSSLTNARNRTLTTLAMYSCTNFISAKQITRHVTHYPFNT